MKMYMVGGAVRDEILGVKSKDIDYSVVLDDVVTVNGVSDPFRTMVLNLQGMGFKIFLETPEHLTVRAQFPREMPAHKFNMGVGMISGLTADFVLARKEGTYTDGRRPDTVEPGTLMDDLARRDFTMNAIAKGLIHEGYIDPFHGQADIANRIIRAVGDPAERLSEDALRAVRAIRFAVTKGFSIDPDLRIALGNKSVLDSLRNNISAERINDEVSKMFKFDTVTSLRLLNKYPALTDAIFAGRVNLDSTLKEKGFRK